MLFFIWLPDDNNSWRRNNRNAFGFDLWAPMLTYIMLRSILLFNSHVLLSLLLWIKAMRSAHSLLLNPMPFCVSFFLPLFFYLRLFFMLFINKFLVAAAAVAATMTAATSCYCDKIVARCLWLSNWNSNKTNNNHSCQTHNVAQLKQLQCI